LYNIFSLCCELAIKLIAAGADVNHQRGRYGTTALCEAVSAKKQDLVAILLEAGANPNIPCKFDGCTPLDYARCIDNWDIAKLLLGAGARHAKYLSYISWAVKKNSFEILGTLLKAHVPLNNENFAELWEDYCKIAESDRDGRIGGFILQHIDQPQK
jgi:ankyrin repeat protein